MACCRDIPCSLRYCSVKVGASSRAASLTTPLLPATAGLSLPVLVLLPLLLLLLLPLLSSSIAIGLTTYCCLPITWKKEEKISKFVRSPPVVKRVGKLICGTFFFLGSYIVPGILFLMLLFVFNLDSKIKFLRVKFFCYFVSNK